MPKLLLLFALLACAATHAAGDTAAASAPASPVTVAVMPFTAKSSFDSGALEGLSSAMGTQLMKTGRFRVLEREQVNMILREQGFQQSGVCDGGECAVQVGKLLSVDRLVVGHVAKVGKIYTLSTRLVNVESGVTEKSVTRNGSTKEETVLTRAIPLAARELAGLPTPTDKEIAEKDRTHWGWWLAGGVVVAGGTAAAVLLLTQDDATATQTTQVVPQNEQIIVVMPQ